jgi:MFS family permease
VTDAPLPPDVPVWRNHAFLRLWAAQAITQTAQNAIWFALLVIVEEATQSTTHLGITILSVILPSVLFGIPAGVYVDRWDNRTVLLVTNLARCAIVLMYIAVGPTVVLLYSVSFVFSLVTQFFAPAEMSMIPRLVGRRLMQANSFFHITFIVSQFVGLVLVGPLVVKLLGTTSFFMSMAAAYWVSALLVWRLPSHVGTRSRGARAHPVGELLSQLGEVLHLLRADRTMSAATGYLTLGMTLTLMVAMLAPRFVVASLGIAASDAVLVLAPAGLGMLGAAFTLSRSAVGQSDRPRIVTVGLLVVAVALGVAAGAPQLARMAGLIAPEGVGLLALSHWNFAVIGVVMLAALLAGCGFAGIVVASQTLLQERAPVGALGRVFAVQLTLGNLCSIVPLILVGGLADLFGVGRVLLAVAGGVLVVALLSARGVAGVARPEPSPQA